MMNRLKSAITVCVMSLTATIFALATPAQAITEMRVDLHLEVQGDYWTGTQTTVMTYSAYLPTDSGWGYLLNGGSITVSCYGSDPIWDDFLFTTVHTVDSPRPLWAGDLGIYLDGIRGEPFEGLFNEDPEGGDEVYCRMTWVDGDGATIQRTTTTRSGNF